MIVVLEHGHYRFRRIASRIKPLGLDLTPQDLADPGGHLVEKVERGHVRQKACFLTIS